MEDEIKTNQIVDLLLSTETEVSNKFHLTVVELLKVGYNSKEGEQLLSELVKCTRDSLDKITELTKI